MQQWKSRSTTIYSIVKSKGSHICTCAYEEAEKSQYVQGKNQMAQMLKLSNNNFKAVFIKILPKVIVNTLEMNGKIESLKKEI